MSNGNISSAEIELLRPWFRPLLRARQRILSVGGPAVVCLTVIVDEEGSPVEPWLVPEITKLEPRVSALEAIEKLLTALKR